MRRHLLWFAQSTIKSSFTREMNPPRTFKILSLSVNLWINHWSVNQIQISRKVCELNKGQQIDYCVLLTAPDLCNESQHILTLPT